MLKKVLCIILCSLMLVSAVACAGPSEDETPGTSEVVNAATSAEDTEPAETEIPLGLEVRDLGENTFTVLGERWSSYVPFDYTDIVADSMNGEVMNDATYTRMLNTEQTYNCKIELVHVMNSEALPNLQKTINSGTHLYDVWLARGTRFSPAITDGYILNLAQYDSIRPENPWWVNGSEEALTLSGKTYGLIGYTSTNFMKAVFAASFNKELIKDNNLESPYELVTAGTWTFDKMLEMSEIAKKDLNGDGVLGPKDIWGLNYTRDEISGMLNSCGLQVGKVNADGNLEYVINDPASIERITDMFEKLFNCQAAVDTLNAGEMQLKATEGDFFVEGTVLFIVHAVHIVDTLRASDINFGMLPLPKYSADDEYASSFGGNYGTVSTIPACADNPEDVAYFLEAFTYEGYRELKPAFFNIILQGKLARDVESSDYLAYIFDEIRLDPGTIFNINSIVSNINGFSTTKDTAVASKMKTFMTAMKKPLQNFNEALAK